MRKLMFSYRLNPFPCKGTWSFWVLQLFWVAGNTNPGIQAKNRGIWAQKGRKKDAHRKGSNVCRISKGSGEWEIENCRMEQGHQVDAIGVEDTERISNKVKLFKLFVAHSKSIRIPLPFLESLNKIWLLCMFRSDVGHRLDHSGF